jgi:hypothetical protein
VTSARPTSHPDQAQRTDGRGGARDARIKRNAWLLGSLALLCYVGYIAYYFLHGAGG